jgi:hypothetical protein
MTLKVGKNVDGWCTRCKLVLTHTIEAVVAGKITRVHCNTCRGQHAYRAEAPGTQAATAARARPASKRASAEVKTRPSEYETLLRGRTAAAARPYSMAARFKVNELITHATFGLGAVTAERDNIKIEVLFPDGARVLVHGRS